MSDYPDHAPNVNGEAAPDEIVLTREGLLAFAIQLHREDRLDAAEACYQTFLRLEPDNANALHYLGMLLGQRGDSPRALDLIQKSIAIDPTVASWHNNLGNVLLQGGAYAEAAAAYGRCSELDPDNIEVLNNLGVLLRNLGRPQEAEDMLLRALAHSPRAGDVHNNLATLYTLGGRMTEAFSHFAEALALRPADPTTRRLLAVAYGHAGRNADGRRICLEWLEAEPDNPQALHLLAAFGGADVPDRASDRYVEDEFDDFANSFDAKLAELNYRAPELVGQAVARLRSPADAQWQVLDVGCGTGLCGPYLRPIAARLVGVDLAGNMLERARVRGIYDELVKCELVAFMNHCKAQQDLIVSADTLCYFGRLDDAFDAVRRTLHAGGHWVFTVEAQEDVADFRLQTHGRYSHSRAYIESALGRAGFSNVDVRDVVLRIEAAKPVAGWLVSAQARP